MGGPTATQQDQIKASAFEFAKAMQLTKGQTMSFVIIALQRKAGLTTQQAITDVLGQQAWDLISANYNTPEEINHAIAEAF